MLSHIRDYPYWIGLFILVPLVTHNLVGSSFAVHTPLNPAKPVSCREDSAKTHGTLPVQVLLSWGLRSYLPYVFSGLIPRRLHGVP